MTVGGLRWDVALAPRGRVRFDGAVAERLAGGDALVLTCEGITKESGPMTWRILIDVTNGYVPTLGLVTVTCEDFTNTEGMWGLCGRGAWYTSLDCTFEDPNREESRDKTENKWVFRQGDEVEMSYDPAAQRLTATVAGKGSTMRRLVGTRSVNVKELYPCVWLYNRENLAGQRVRLLGRKGASLQEAEWHTGRVVLIHHMLEKVLSEVTSMRKELKDVRQECKNDIAALRAAHARAVAEFGSRLGAGIEYAAQNVTQSNDVRNCVRNDKDLPESPAEATTVVAAAINEGKMVQGFRLAFEWAYEPSPAQLAPLVIGLSRAVENHLNSEQNLFDENFVNGTSDFTPLLVGEDRTLRGHALIGLARVLAFLPFEHGKGQQDVAVEQQNEGIQAIVCVLECVVRGVKQDYPRRDGDMDAKSHQNDVADAWDDVVRTVHTELSRIAVSVAGRKFFGRVLLRRIQRVVCELMHVLTS